MVFWGMFTDVEVALRTRVGSLRHSFRLKSNNPEMYLHWQRMEIAEREWSKALAVADRAIKILPDAYEIVERKVYTLRQAGFDLHRGLHREKAEKMWIEAVEEVKRRIKTPGGSSCR